MFGVLTAPTLRAQDNKKPAASESNKSSSEAKPYKNIGVEEFAKLASDKKNVVLDVRTAKEFQDGHIPGAINIDVNAPDFEKKVAALDKTKVYLVHCAAGRRSAKACDKLGELKFSHLYNLEPGYNGWTKDGKAVER
ncbi:MAG: rhodanese-like domain-containing protein [Verrucomicrobia bacterium]|nr:rhodanese-like domain-containing protein [Verrucomicrobiota bacterium]